MLGRELGPAHDPIAIGVRRLEQRRLRLAVRVRLALGLVAVPQDRARDRGCERAALASSAPTVWKILACAVHRRRRRVLAVAVRPGTCDRAAPMTAEPSRAVSGLGSRGRALAASSDTTPQRAVSTPASWIRRSSSSRARPARSYGKVEHGQLDREAAPDATFACRTGNVGAEPGHQSSCGADLALRPPGLARRGRRRRGAGAADHAAGAAMVAQPQQAEPRGVAQRARLCEGRAVTPHGHLRSLQGLEILHRNESGPRENGSAALVCPRPLSTPRAASLPLRAGRASWAPLQAVA